MATSSLAMAELDINERENCRRIAAGHIKRSPRTKKDSRDGHSQRLGASIRLPRGDVRLGVDRAVQGEIR